MKKILLKLLIPIFVFFNSSYLIAGDYNLGITIDGGTTSIYRINKATGAGTLLETTTLLQSLNTDRSYVDSANGNLIIRGGAPISGDDVWLSYDIDADTITQLTTPDVENVFMFENAWDGKAAEEIITTGTDAEDSSTTTILGSLDISDSSGNTLIEQNATGTTIGIGEDASGETGLIISNTSTALDIQDGAGDTVIKVTSDGATHIGENSLITIETGGVQQLYATNSSGQQIDIDIKSGTNLLIGGRNIIDIIGGDISGSVALSSALAALPNASPDAFYTCGVGTGIHDSSSALSAGCASDFANYAFVDKMPEFFQRASFNIGSSFLMNGEPDISEVRDMSIKAGITFKFGSAKPVRVADKQNRMLENKIDSVMYENISIREENKNLRAQLEEENDSIRQENDILKAQIADINMQLKALNMVAMN